MPELCGMLATARSMIAQQGRMAGLSVKTVVLRHRANSYGGYRVRWNRIVANLRLSAEQQVSS